MRGRRMAFAGEREGPTRRADSHSVSSSESVELSQLDGKGARRLLLSPLENASHPCSSPGDTAPADCDARCTSNTLHVSPAESVNVLAAMVTRAHRRMAGHTGWCVGAQRARGAQGMFRTGGAMVGRSDGGMVGIRPSDFPTFWLSDLPLLRRRDRYDVAGAVGAGARVAEGAIERRRRPFDRPALARRRVGLQCRLEAAHAVPDVVPPPRDDDRVRMA